MRAMLVAFGVVLALILWTISSTQAQQSEQNDRPDLVVIVVQFKQRTEPIARLMADAVEATNVKIVIQDSRETGVSENLGKYFGKEAVNKFKFDEGDIAVVPLLKDKTGCRLAGKAQLHHVPSADTSLAAAK
jgi:hypothetical protein